ncbi:MAG: type II CRISPR RNA-guided endonuclease Cas9 [Vallitaleaceae bacterium]|nr:type II CRISPR RNA-guided endonuclease Cas9 [Vallitaleaceae bacterium]
MKKEIKYSIGLDIGTNSVGYAIVDENNQIVRFNKKNMIGVRLFDGGKTAEITRNFRSARRRLKRRHNRIELLRELVGEEVLKLDHDFFDRLDSSFLLQADKKAQSRNILFNDVDFNDASFHKIYPTNYHLRKAIIDSSEQMDIRLIYLAIHHILKYRGHFLYGTGDISIKGNLFDDLNELIVYSAQFYTLTVVEMESLVQNIHKVLVDQTIVKSDKLSEIKTLYKENNNVEQGIVEVFKAVLGNKANFNQIFMVTDTNDKLSIHVGDDDAPDKVEPIAGDDFKFFEMIHKVYNGCILHNLLNGKNTLSEAMIKIYGQHKKDLADLKLVLRKYNYAKYEEFFKVKKAGDISYVKYIANVKNVSNEDLNAEVKKTLLNLTDNVSSADQLKINRILASIDRYDFLKKVRSKDNAAIPMQLHLNELKTILEKQSKFHHVLEENSEKIISIIKFKIPYYVGPLNSNSKNNRQFAWATRKVEGVKIYPWNFDDIIDKEQSAEDFIKRMTNRCSYLPEEDVIPKKSLLYSKFEVLNELNKVRINGILLDHQQKIKIYNELFLNIKVVTMKKLDQWLKVNGVSEENKITGLQKEDKFASTLTPWIDFKRIIGREVMEKDFEMVEELIYWATIFNDKDIIRTKIKNKYHELSDKQINQVLQLSYSGWSRLSRKLLDGIRVKDIYNQYITIIDVMENSNKNFMQIINDKQVGFDKIIESLRIRRDYDKITYEDVNALPTSPANKKGIWQTTQVVNELVKIMGEAPQNIYIEMARGEEDKRRSESRINKIKRLYDTNAKEIMAYNGEVSKQLKGLEKSEKLDSDRIFLYFLQEGKCLYTGTSLQIDNLSSYDIDHIIPKSYIKDDSIDNRALVLNTENKRKLDNMLLEEDIIRKQSRIWKHLYDVGLMSRKKYTNLTRRSFSEEELRGFLNRQLVETRQISKHVMHLFEDCYDDGETTIHSIKAQLTSDFRKHFQCYKVRQINDFHHAHDAYLACVIGRYISIRFPYLESSTTLNGYRTHIQANTRGRYGYIIDSMNNQYVDRATGEILWDPKDEISSCKKILGYKNILISRKKEELTDQFYKQLAKAKNEGKIPIKEGLDPDVYGGYLGEQVSYYTVIEHVHKNKIKKSIVGIPVQKSYLIKKGMSTLIKVLEDDLGYKNCKIIKEKIMKYQLFERNGDLFYIVSDKEVINAKQLILSHSTTKKLYMMNKSRNREVIDEELIEIYDEILAKMDCHYKRYNGISKKLLEAKAKFVELENSVKIKFLNNLLFITQANAVNADLSKYGLPKFTAREGRIGNYAFAIEDMIFIDQSVTGLFESRYTV